MGSETAAAKTVLIIDDDDFVRTMVTKLVTSFGYSSTCARDGIEALDVLKNMPPPDIVITDIVMPRMDGLEMVRQLRAKFPEIKIVAVSGGGRSEQGDYLELARKSGANEVVNKPINPKDLKEILKQMAEAT
jgi:CheY-like chemotaxis protein